LIVEDLGSRNCIDLLRNVGREAIKGRVRELSQRPSAHGEVS